jgi:hypothetical protein
VALQFFSVSSVFSLSNLNTEDTEKKKDTEKLSSPCNAEAANVILCGRNFYGIEQFAPR